MRVTLVALDVETAAAVVAEARDGRRWAPDFPAGGDRIVARLLVASDPGEGAPWDQPWLVEHKGVVVGTVGFKGPPHAGSIEVGYGLVPSARGQGLATEAVGALLDMAAASGIGEVVAETAVDNGPSQGVLRRLGFAEVGRREDEEDGELIVWRRRSG